MAAKLVIFYSSGVLRCSPAASSSHSAFRIIISEAAELPSLLQTLEDVHKNLGTGDTEEMKLLWIFCKRAVPVETGPALAPYQHSHSVNVPRVFMSSMAFSVGPSLACLFSLSQKRDAEVTIVVGWLSWKFTVFKLQLQVHTLISEVGSASKGEGN